MNSMSDGKSKILVLVEGAKTDVKLMQKLFEVYGISERYEILSYNTAAVPLSATKQKPTRISFVRTVLRLTLQR